MILAHRAGNPDEGVQVCQDCGMVLAEAAFQAGFVIPGSAGMPRGGFYELAARVCTTEDGALVPDVAAAKSCRPARPSSGRGRQDKSPERPPFLPAPKGPGA